MRSVRHTALVCMSREHQSTRAYWHILGVVTRDDMFVNAVVIHVWEQTMLDGTRRTMGVDIPKFKIDYYLW